MSNVGWEQIERFIGYGRLDAPVVFVGMEEGGEDDPERLRADLVRRSTYDQVAELQSSGGLKKTWRPMCYLMLRRQGQRDPTGNELRNYQNEQLGRRHGDTLLTELLPYPHRKASDWHDIFKQRFESRAEYKAVVLRRRKGMLREVLGEARREIIVCYGKHDWSEYECLFDNVSWRDKLPYRVADINGTRLVLAPHFVSRGNFSNVQLQDFAAVALAR